MPSMLRSYQYNIWIHLKALLTKVKLNYWVIFRIQKQSWNLYFLYNVLSRSFSHILIQIHAY